MKVAPVFLLLSLTLSSTAPADPPANDHVAQALVISWPGEQASSLSGMVSTVEATAEPGEPAHGGVPAQRTAWVKFTAGNTGAAGLTVEFQRYALAGGKFDLYEEASLAALIPLAPLQEIPGIGSVLRYRVYAVTAGKTYLLALNDTQDVSSPIRIQVSRMTLARFPNDDFASRTRIQPEVYEDHFRFPQSNYWYYGSLESGEPAMPQGSEGATESLWWDYVPVTTGWYATFVTDGTTLELFHGTTLESLAPLSAFVTGPAAPDYAGYHFYGGYTTRYYHLEAGQPAVCRRVFSGAGWSRMYLSPAEGYELFALEAGLPPAQWSLAANPAGDGFDNLTKYLLGVDPANSAGADPRVGHLPHMVVKSGGEVDIVFTVDLAALARLRESGWDRVEVWMATSSNLTNWQWFVASNFYAGKEESSRFKELRFPMPAGAQRVFFKMDINVVHEHDN